LGAKSSVTLQIERQFTATAYIIDRKREKTLLIFHPKMSKWLPPGGHVEANETPPDAAKREALEETGIEIEIIPQENIWIDRWNAKSLQRPYLCLLEEIPAHNGKPAHQHIDMIYVAHPLNNEAPLPANGCCSRWFTFEEIEKLEGDIEIFEETRMTLRHLLQAS
jgi:8-oxo-dGTP pyrophosphatase MutT (NUDIX family)